MTEKRPAKQSVKSEASTRQNQKQNESARPVHFELTDPAARSVCIAGSFNDWRPETTEMVAMGGGKWTKDMSLPPGTYEYRLVVDGRWMPDPNASRTVPNPFGETNSLLIVPPVLQERRRPVPE